MSRLRLCAGPLAFCLLDATLTLLGQGEAYWSGDRLAAREANPLGLWLLQLHPSAFVAGVAGSLTHYALVLAWLPANLARVAAFAILFLHAVGASTWLLPWGTAGYLMAVLLLLAGSRVLVLCWQRPAEDRSP